MRGSLNALLLIAAAAAIVAAQPVASSFCDASSEYAAAATSRRMLLLREAPDAAAAATRLLKPDAAGYVTINASAGSALYYAYYEARETQHYEERERPVLLWLQVWVGAFYFAAASPPLPPLPPLLRPQTIQNTTKTNTHGRPGLRVDVWIGVRARPGAGRRAPRRAAALQPPLVGARVWAADRRPARRRRL